MFYYNKKPLYLVGFYFVWS